MTIELRTKINQLLAELPEGAVATITWLQKQGISPQLAAHYEKSGWFETIGHGAYVRSKDQLNWQGAVYALQSQLELDLHVGGKTALALKRLLHFIPQTEEPSSFLYLFHGKRKLPTWFLNYQWGIKLSSKPDHLFGDEQDKRLGLTIHQEGGLDLKISSPERAFMELLYFVPTKQSLDEALLILEGLVTLRPGLIQQLLVSCTSIKVKRLFLALSEQCNHAWMKSLDVSKINLGKGKRMIGEGGAFNSQFLITVPKKQGEFDDQ